MPKLTKRWGIYSRIQGLYNYNSKQGFHEISSIYPLLKFEPIVAQHLISMLKRMQQLNEVEANDIVLKAYLTALLAEMRLSIDFQIRMSISAYERITFGFKKLLHTNILNNAQLVFMHQN